MVPLEDRRKQPQGRNCLFVLLEIYSLPWANVQNISLLLGATLAAKSTFQRSQTKCYFFTFYLQHIIISQSPYQDQRDCPSHV